MRAPLQSNMAEVLETIRRFAPEFLIAWACWLPALLGARAERKLAGSDQLASLVLSLASLTAIALPGKNHPHYYHLLIPTSLFVLVMALRHTRLAQERIEVSA